MSSSVSTSPTKDAQVKAIYDEVRELWCTARRAEAEARCREGLREFPDAYCLMEELAWNLSYSSKRERLEESITLFERLRSRASDEGTRNFALGTLCELYMKTGKTAEAKQLAESIPTLTYTKDDCIRMTLRGEAWAEHVRGAVAGKFGDMISDLRNLLTAYDDNHPLFSAEALLALWQKVIDLIDTFYEDGDYAFDAQWVIEAHAHRASLLAVRGEAEAALTELELMQMQIDRYDAYADGLLGDRVILPREKWHTSILVRPHDEQASAPEMTVSRLTGETAAQQYLRTLSAPVFDPIRNHDRFRVVEDKLRASANA